METQEKECEENSSSDEEVEDDEEEEQNSPEDKTKSSLGTNLEITKTSQH